MNIDYKSHIVYMDTESSFCCYSVCYIYCRSVLNARCFVAILLDLDGKDNKTRSASADDIHLYEKPLYQHTTKTLSAFNVALANYKTKHPHSNSGENWILPVDLTTKCNSDRKDDSGLNSIFSGHNFRQCYVVDSSVTSTKNPSVKNENHETRFQGFLSGWRSAVSSVVKRM